MSRRPNPHRGAQRDLAPLERWTRDLLTHALPAELHYHDAHHTFGEVVPEARRLARAERLGATEGELVIAAALLHDCGFTERYADHERASAELAGAVLPEHGFAPHEVLAVQGMILATELGSEPVTRGQKVLVDADLSVLGRPDFRERNDALRRELAARGARFGDVAWLRGQIAFLKRHRYRTEAARAAWAAAKARNLRELEARLAALGGG